MDNCFDVIESGSEDKDEFAVVVDQVLHAVQTLNKLAGGPAFQQEPFNSLPANSEIVDHLSASASSLGGQFIDQGRTLLSDMNDSMSEDVGVDSVAGQFTGFQTMNPAAGSEMMEERGNGELESMEDMEVGTQNQEDMPQESVVETEDEASGNAAFVQETEESTHASGVGEDYLAGDKDQQAIDAEEESEIAEHGLETVSDLDLNRIEEPVMEENLETGVLAEENDDEIDHKGGYLEIRNVEEGENEDLGDADNSLDMPEQKVDVENQAEQDGEDQEEPEERAVRDQGEGEKGETMDEIDKADEDIEQIEKNTLVEDEVCMNKTDETVEETDGQSIVDKGAKDIDGTDDQEKEMEVEKGEKGQHQQTGDEAVIDHSERDKDDTKILDHSEKDKDNTETLDHSKADKDDTETLGHSKEDKDDTEKSDHSERDKDDTETLDHSQEDKDDTETLDHSEKEEFWTPSGRPARKRRRVGSDHDYSAHLESKDKESGPEKVEKPPRKRKIEEHIDAVAIRQKACNDKDVGKGKGAEGEAETSIGDEATAPADISGTSYGYHDAEDRMREEPIDREVDVQDYQTPKAKKSNLRDSDKGQKVDDSVISDLFQVPQKLGWFREIVIRSVTDDQKSGLKNPKKIPADVYYYTPTGKKLRSKKEIQSHLHHINTDLTIDNFTFYKIPVYRGDGESIRLAKAQKGRTHSQADLADLLRQYNSPVGSRSFSRLSNSRATPSPKVQEAPPVPPAASSPFPRPASPAPPAPPKVQVTEAKPVKVVTQTGTPHRPRIIYTPQRFQVSTPKARGPVARKRMGGVVGKKQLAVASAKALSTDGEVITTLMKETEHSPPPKKVKIGPSVMGAVKLCGLNCPGVEGVAPDLHCGVCMCLFHPQCVQFTGSTRPALFVCLSCRTRVGKKGVESETTTTAPQTTAMPGITMKVIKNTAGDANTDVISTATTNPVTVLSSTPQIHTAPVNMESSVIGDVVSRALSEVRSMPGTAVTMTSVIKQPPTMIPAPTLPVNRPIPSTAPTLIAAPGVVVTRTAAVQPNGSPVVMNSLSLSASSGSVASMPVSKPGPSRSTGNMPVSGQLLTLPDSISQKIDMKQPLQLKLNNQSVILPPSCLLATSGGVKVFLPPGTVAMQNGGSGSNSASKESTKSTKPPKVQETPCNSNSAILNHLQGNIEQTKAQTGQEVGTSALNNMVSDAIQTVMRSSRSRRINPALCHFQKLHVGFDCMLQIFGYLNVTDLLRASRVCRTWWDVASQHWMWKVVRLRGSRVADWDAAVKHFKKHNTVRLDMRGMLHFEDRNRTWHQFTAVLDQLKFLRHIDFGQSPATILHQAADKLTELKVLTAEWITDMSTEPNMWTTNVKLDVAKFANLKQLEEIKLRGVCGLVLPAFSFSGGLTDLCCLKLRSLSLTTLRDIPDHEFRFLESMTHLEFLELGDCTTFTAETYSQLKELTNLKHLRLECGGEIPDNGLGDAVSNLVQLEQLELINFTIPPSLIHAFGDLKKLKTVSVWPSMATHSAQVNTNTYKAMITISHLKQLDWGILADNSPDQQEENDLEKTNTPQEKLDSIPFQPELSQLDSENAICDVDLSTEFIGINQLVEKLSASLPDTKIRVFRVPMFSAGKANRAS